MAALSQAQSAEHAAITLPPRIPMPSIIYGTAWKGPASQPLVLTALRAGFRALDTSAQLKHYDEAAVGEGVRDALTAAASDPDLHGLTRSQLWIQTKCTPPAGQDWSRPVPYKRTDRPAIAVRKSFAASLWNLATDQAWREAHPPPPNSAQRGSLDLKGKGRDLTGSDAASGGGDNLSPLEVLSDAAVSLLPGQQAANATAQVGPQYPDEGSILLPHLRPRTSASEPYIDSYLLHSPFDSLEDIIEAWREMENLVRLGWIRRIGLSNVYDPRILQLLRGYMVTTPSQTFDHGQSAQSIPTYPIAPTILQNRWHNSTLHDVSLFSILSPTLSPNDFADVAGRISSQKPSADEALAALRAKLASPSDQLEAPEPDTDDPTQVQPMTYQAFWILTGNPTLLTKSSILESVQILNAYLPQSISPPVPAREPLTALQQAVLSVRWTPQMLVYATVALGLGGVPGLSTSVLCGSTDQTHMVEALVAVYRAEALRAAETGIRPPWIQKNPLGPKEREREEAHNVALRDAVDAIRKIVYGE
ncbi:hypothetical protein OC846_004376 [Tilletia horrida]|uniref:NADP-dependent oxidoreductase domain-containing protein n=1 Tax=Tilletia horrida TaxID=155126 RepID=A0AAN6GQY3_9BASI|nr:hypothetical protein OC846_004376 [Tilletia horrida]KAK0563864.1 hypothetical protein OC861_004604 [Tilletia horrida]